MDNLGAARATGRPRIGVFLHLGNWELAGPKMLSLGETSAQIAQTLATTGNFQGVAPGVNLVSSARAARSASASSSA